MYRVWHKLGAPVLVAAADIGADRFERQLGRGLDRRFDRCRTGDFDFGLPGSSATRVSTEAGSGAGASCSTGLALAATASTAPRTGATTG